MIKGQQVYLKELTPDDVTTEYVNWLNNPEINEYLECRHFIHTVDTVKDFVENIYKNKEEIIFGIFDIKNNKHIGNIKIGPILDLHKRADVGILIGNKSYWGKGIGSEAVQIATKYAFESLGLQKLCSGAYIQNKGSIKIFLKNGWAKVGVFKKHIYYKNGFTDVVELEILNQ